MSRVAALARAEFVTLRLRLLKVVARAKESATRIRIAFASACPDANLFRAMVRALKQAPTYPVRRCRRNPEPNPSTRKVRPLR